MSDKVMIVGNEYELRAILFAENKRKQLGHWALVNGRNKIPTILPVFCFHLGCNFIAVKSEVSVLITKSKDNNLKKTKGETLLKNDKCI